MECFNDLLQVANYLLGVNGCPWDKEQTLFTLQPYLLEESHELVEAIDSQEKAKIVEELGDVFYTLIFIAKLGEINQFFTLEEVLRGIKEKLIRRHPHVFGDIKAQNAEEVVRVYEAAKSQEKEKRERKTVLEGIPPSLPILARAQKVIEKLKIAKTASRSNQVSEEEVGKNLWELIIQAEQFGINAESALRRYCSRWEKKNTGD